MSEIYPEAPGNKGSETTLGEVFHGEYAAAQRRFMRDSREWDDLSPTEQGSIEAGATAVADHVARSGYQGPQRHPDTTECDGFHLAGEQCNLPPGSGPQPAKVIVVTEVRSAGMTGERRFPADELRHHANSGVIELYRDGRRIALYNQGTWMNFRDLDAEGPDTTTRALGIAKLALEAVTRISDPNAAIKLATDALNDIWTETEG